LELIIGPLDRPFTNLECLPFAICSHNTLEGPEAPDVSFVDLKIISFIGFI
jgi:hypothetical protein